MFYVYILIIIYCLLIHYVFSSRLNQTLACCNEKAEQTQSLSCFFKQNHPDQSQSNQQYLTSTIVGGLGNQLFIMFTTISYAIKYNLPFIFDYTPDLHYRKTHWDGLYASLTCFSTKYNIIWQTIFNSTTFPMSNYSEKAFYYTEIPPPSQLKSNINRFTNGLKLNGYYQSYKYFHEYKRIIFRSMNIYNLQSQIYDRYFHPYFNTSKYVVAIHFRIGDYIRITKIYPIIPLQYYTNAIQHIITDLNIPNKSIRLLCVYDPNDNNRITNDYLEPLRIKFPGIEFTVVDSAMPDWHQMLLMSLCRVIIIPNSTFAW